MLSVLLAYPDLRVSRSEVASDQDISLWYSHKGVAVMAVGLTKMMGGKFGGLLGVGGRANPLTELEATGEGVLEQLRSEPE